MRAAVFTQPGAITVADRPDPVLHSTTDAIVSVSLSCVCGSDLWYFRGESPRAAGQPTGHEFVGVVEEVGADVMSLRVGDTVVAPFRWSDGSCAHCRFGYPTACTAGGIWGQPGSDGGQGQYVRVPFADATLVAVPGGTPDPELLPALLSLSDVMATGHFAAVSAGVTVGATVAVVGDGAVGLCGVLAARRLGATRIIALSSHAARSSIAVSFGATDIVQVRGAEATATLLEMTDGVGVDGVLECVGTEQSMATALSIVRPGGRLGYVGVPHGAHLPLEALFARNVTVSGGLAPARRYLPELLGDVLNGSLDPSPVFDHEVSLEDIQSGYRAMDDRSAVKVLVTIP